MNETIKEYIKQRWVPTALGVIASTIVYGISFIGIYASYRVDYLALKQKVDAQIVTIDKILSMHELIVTKEVQIIQKQEDDRQLLEDIHYAVLNR